MTIKPDERKRIAGLLGIHEQYLYQILTGRKPAPAEFCATIERETCGVYPRWRLRPRDWQVVWPELRDRADAPSASVVGLQGPDRRTPEDDGDWVACPARRATDRPELVARQQAPIGLAPEVSDAA